MEKGKIIDIKTEVVEFSNLGYNKSILLDKINEIESQGWEYIHHIRIAEKELMKFEILFIKRENTYQLFISENEIITKKAIKPPSPKPPKGRRAGYEVKCRS